MKNSIKRLIILLVFLAVIISLVGSKKDESIEVNMSKVQNCNTIYWETTKNVYGEVEKSYTCKTDYLNYTLSPNYFWCWDYLSNNQSYTLLFGHHFDRRSLATKTIWWNETEFIGTETIEHSKEECNNTGIFNINMGKKGKSFNWVCNSSDWGDCSLDIENNILICDSNRDGNEDGICDSGESCLIIDITKEGLKRNKNKGFHAILEEYDIECEIQ